MALGFIEAQPGVSAWLAIAGLCVVGAPAVYLALHGERSSMNINYQTVMPDELDELDELDDIELAHVYSGDDLDDEDDMDSVGHPEESGVV